MINDEDAEICSWCRNFNLEQASTWEGYHLHENVAELLKCASKCQLCDVAYTVARNSPAKSWEDETDSCLSRYIPLIVYWPGSTRFPKGAEISNELDVLVLEQDQKAILSPCFEAEQDQNYELPRRKHWVDIWVLENEQNDPSTVPPNLAPFPRLCSIPDSTSSSSTFVKARNWLECCLSGECGPLNEARGPLSSIHPARLIEIINFEQSKLKLADGNICSQSPYVALSYCWGTDHAPWKTISSNLEARKLGFSLDDLPKTLANAVEITTKLGLRYVWIDSICIVQDSREDWEIEANKMSGVYNNATVTITADSSPNSHAGIFNEESRGYAEDLPHPKVTIPCDDERFKLLLSGKREKVQWFGSVLMGCLATRGWCCQESILSPRILHFTATQVFWECAHRTRSEDNHTEHRWGSTSADDSFKKRILHAANDSRACDALIHSWYAHIVADRYSGRRLTNPSDKLVAVGGIAEFIARIHRIPYYAGIWQHSLILGLSWKRLASRGRVAVYRAPSWSWASQEGRIDWSPFYLHQENPREYARVHDIVVHKTSASDYGQVSGGSLFLSAPSIRGYTSDDRVAENRFGVQLESEYLLGAMLDDDQFVNSHVRVCLMCHTDFLSQPKNRSLHFLLLARLEGQEACFQRVGSATKVCASVEESEELLRMFNDAPEETFRVL